MIVGQNENGNGDGRRVRHPQHLVWGYDRTPEVENFRSQKMRSFQSQLTAGTGVIRKGIWALPQRHLVSLRCWSGCGFLRTWREFRRRRAKMPPLDPPRSRGPYSRSRRGASRSSNVAVSPIIRWARVGMKITILPWLRSQPSRRKHGERTRADEVGHSQRLQSRSSHLRNNC